MLGYLRVYCTCICTGLGVGDYIRCFLNGTGQSIACGVGHVSDLAVYGIGFGELRGEDLVVRRDVEVHGGRAGGLQLPESRGATSRGNDLVSASKSLEANRLSEPARGTCDEPDVFGHCSREMRDLARGRWIVAGLSVTKMSLERVYALLQEVAMSLSCSMLYSPSLQPSWSLLYTTSRLVKLYSPPQEMRTMAASRECYERKYGRKTPSGSLNLPSDLISNMTVDDLAELSAKTV